MYYRASSVSKKRRRVTICADGQRVDIRRVESKSSALLKDAWICKFVKSPYKSNLNELIKER